jgi:sugar phosphate isomerase/epimerase
VKLALYTDSLGARPLPEVLDVALEAGVEGLELATGGQSSAPHLDLGALLGDPSARDRLLAELRARGLAVCALNCSAWPLHPVLGEESKRLIESTLDLAELLEVDTVVTMSGTPGDTPSATTFTWSWYPWPSDQTALLDRQWEGALALWDGLVSRAKRSGVERLAFELHPLHLVYNVPTLQRMRVELGPVIGANVDPSHLVWQRMDPSAVVGALGAAVQHVHLKDTRYSERELHLAGVLDSRSFADPHRRAWTFCTVGRGHDAAFWLAFLQSLRAAGYEGPLAIENEDPFVGDVEGVQEAAGFIRPLLAAAIS